MAKVVVKIGPSSHRASVAPDMVMTISTNDASRPRSAEAGKKFSFYPPVKNFHSSVYSLFSLTSIILPYCNENDAEKKITEELVMNGEGSSSTNLHSTLPELGKY
ncbi:hypothetical protein T4B_2833 [Trichinella pseudospiralis]|uniref:Uncharacterized protein n=1 Tax=Trichinella pseudospiralis TaxID=6337 RepID=A0A0V1IC02_TRIPS|nr:hypothetical protein T4B_2833 [Trichinella pseudospiralis]